MASLTDANHDFNSIFFYSAYILFIYVLNYNNTYIVLFIYVLLQHERPCCIGYIQARAEGELRLYIRYNTDANVVNSM